MQDNFYLMFVFYLWLRGQKLLLRCWFFLTAASSVINVQRTQTGILGGSGVVRCSTTLPGAYVEITDPSSRTRRTNAVVLNRIKESDEGVYFCSFKDVDFEKTLYSVGVNFQVLSKMVEIINHRIHFIHSSHEWYSQRILEGYSSQSCLWMCVCLLPLFQESAWIAVLQFQSQLCLDLTLQDCIRISW